MIIPFGCVQQCLIEVNLLYGSMLPTCPKRQCLHTQYFNPLKTPATQLNMKIGIFCGIYCCRNKKSI